MKNPFVQLQCAHTLSSVFVQLQRSNRHLSSCRTCLRRQKGLPPRKAPPSSRSFSSSHRTRTSSDGVVLGGDETVEKRIADGIPLKPAECFPIHIEFFNATVDSGPYVDEHQTLFRLEAADINPQEMLNKRKNLLNV